MAPCHIISWSIRLIEGLCGAQGELSFRQSPTFQDCYPGSEKCYNEVEHNGEVLRVSTYTTQTDSRTSGQHSSS